MQQLKNYSQGLEALQYSIQNEKKIFCLRLELVNFLKKKEKVFFADFYMKSHYTSQEEFSTLPLQQILLK